MTVKNIPATCLVDNTRVKFELNTGLYQNIITFFNANNLSFLTEKIIDFSKIPLRLHGKGVSKNILEYFANNTENGNLIFNFLNYYIANILDIEYEYEKKLIFKFYENIKWQNINFEASDYIPTPILNVLKFKYDSTFDPSQWISIEWNTPQGVPPTYSTGEVGVITIDLGNGTEISSNYADDYISGFSGSSGSSGIYNARISTTGTKNFDSCFTFECHDWWIIDRVFDLSIFKNLYYLEFGNSHISELKLPTDHHKSQGIAIILYTCDLIYFNYPIFDYTSMITTKDKLEISDMSNLISINFPSGSKFYNIHLEKFPELTTLDTSNMIITNEYDSEKCYYSVHDMMNLTEILTPIFDSDMYEIDISGCTNLQSLTLNLTTTIVEHLSVIGTPNLSTLSIPLSTVTTTQSINIIETNLSVIDLTYLHLNNAIPAINGYPEFWITNNPLLTNLIIGTSSGLISGGVNNNPNLDYVGFTTLTNLMRKNNTGFNIQNNNWSASIINHVLMDLDSIIVGGFTGRTLYIKGSVTPNADPDGTSGGFDGLTAITNLQAKGVFINVT